MNAALMLLAGGLGVVTQPLHTRTDDILIEFAPRTPDQMGSFYEARGFPRAMLDRLKDTCYITVRIHNTSEHTIWHELENWEFSVNGEPVEREHRDVWKQRWQDMGIPLRFQSTFRWTLLPETLDYLPGEVEGGNIVLPRIDQPITLKASFKTGKDKQGPVIKIEYNKLHCANDAATESER
jgi:hypothetical protein